MDGFKIELPLENEYFTTVRLTCGGICAQADFDVDFTEDIKVCVTESLLILKRNGFKRAEISFTIGEGLLAQIEGKDQTGDKADGVEDEISYALLDALIGGVELNKDNDGRVVSVRFQA
jgi:hypothetical protein